MGLKASVNDGILTIQMPFDKTGIVSSTKKTILHASENSKADVKGVGLVSVNCNIYTPNPAYVKPEKTV